MANPEYIENLRAVIGKVHGCDSKHVESVPVHEVFEGETAWRGEAGFLIRRLDVVLGEGGEVQLCSCWSKRR